jgi:hypothetical protein
MLLEPTDGEAVHGRFSLSHLHPCDADEQAPTPDPSPYTHAHAHAHTHTHTPALEIKLPEFVQSYFNSYRRPHRAALQPSLLNSQAPAAAAGRLVPLAASGERAAAMEIGVSRREVLSLRFRRLQLWRTALPRAGPIPRANHGEPG